ncbi:hypothetical protein ABZ281_29330 [Streptomyces sp. NPDC006265]|uniref:DUF6907 domain-containing protein n=1 Tax=Streptomyces sp. NPDC006265 TaxID=3156740 RepID=UPI0033BF73E6
MSAPRSITLPTVDHGDVTITCPAWCVAHETDARIARADIVHLGPDVALAFRGRHLIEAGLAQSPFGNDTAPGISVSLLGRTLDARGVYELAAALDTYADRLRDLADQLLVVLEEGDL